MITQFLRRRLKENDAQALGTVIRLIKQKNKVFARVYARLHRKVPNSEGPNQLQVQYARQRSLRQANWEHHRQTLEQLAKDEETAAKQQQEQARKALLLKHRTASLQQLQRQKEARRQLTASLEKFRRPDLSIKPLYQIYEERHSTLWQQAAPPPRRHSFRLKDLRQHLSWYKAQRGRKTSLAAVAVSDRRFVSSLGTRMCQEDQLRAEAGSRLKQQKQVLASKKKLFAQSVKELFKPRVKPSRPAEVTVATPVKREVQEWKPVKFAPNPMLPRAPPPRPPPVRAAS